MGLFDNLKPEDFDDEKEEPIVENNFLKAKLPEDCRRALDILFNSNVDFILAMSVPVSTEHGQDRSVWVELHPIKGDTTSLGFLAMQVLTACINEVVEIQLGKVESTGDTDEPGDE